MEGALWQGQSCLQLGILRLGVDVFQEEHEISQSLFVKNLKVFARVTGFGGVRMTSKFMLSAK